MARGWTPAASGGPPRTPPEPRCLAHADLARTRRVGVQEGALLAGVGGGAAVWCNADSFVGGHGEACAQGGWRLPDLGIGDFVASDAHRPERPSRLREAVEAIAARHGDERALA